MLTNTHACAHSLSPLACCAALTTLYLHMCVCGKTSLQDNPPPAIVQHQHIVFFFFFHQRTHGIDFFNLISKNESENKSLTEPLGRKPSYISQRIGFRKHISTNILFPRVYTGWRLDTKWLTGEKRL